MAHYAEIKDNIVQRVIVAEQDFIESGLMGDPTSWIQCSYNTFGGEHIRGGEPIRKNYPGVGYTYDPELDAFIPPQPFPSWTLNTDTCLWEAPVPEPENRIEYKWNEYRLDWVRIV